MFTDGACEAERRFGGIGGILVSPQGSCVSYFSAEVRSWMMDKLLMTSANPIHELELLPILLQFGDHVSVSLKLFGMWTMSHQGWPSSEARAKLSTLSNQIMVPSHSNPDGVSRLPRDIPLSLGAEQTT